MTPGWVSFNSAKGAVLIRREVDLCRKKGGKLVFEDAKNISITDTRHYEVETSIYADFPSSKPFFFAYFYLRSCGFKVKSRAFPN